MDKLKFFLSLYCTLIVFTLNPSKASKQMVNCSNNFSCPQSTTCCNTTSVDFACCPHQSATCCTDGKHCCPEGFDCDIETSSCKQKKFFDESSRILFLGDKIGKSDCPSNETQCIIGCCPLPNAHCCSDLVTCCPSYLRCIPFGPSGCV